MVFLLGTQKFLLNNHTCQPNRLLVYKPPRIRLLIPEEVVMQPGLFIIILVLQSKRLMRVLIDPLILFQTTLAGVVAEP